MHEVHDVDVAVDRSTCIGNGICAALAPHAFRLDHQLKAEVLAPQREDEQALWDAATACPVQAIYLSAGGKPLYP